MTRSQLLGSAACAATLLITSQAAAQQQQGPSVEEILVTARKRVEKLQEVPLAVSAFTSSQLEEQTIKSVDELSKLMTGMSFDSEFGRQADRPVIRGSGNILPNASSGVAYFIDGVYFPGDLQDFNMDDVASIEVIKGPQSALYGRNTYSGAISIKTKAPTASWRGSVKLEGAEFGQYDASAHVSGPVVKDVFGIALSGRYYKRDGIGGDIWTNAFDGRKMGDQESKSVNFTAYLTPNDRTEIRTRVHYAEKDDGQPPIFLKGYEENNCFTDIGNRRPLAFSPDFSSFAYGGGSVYLGAGRYICGEVKPNQISVDDERSLGAKAETDSRTLLASFSIDYKLTDDVTFSYIGGYNDGTSKERQDFDHQPTSFGVFLTSSSGMRPLTSTVDPGDYEYVVTGSAPAANFASWADGKSWDMSHEFRVSYLTDKLDIIAGAYFFKSKSSYTSTQPYNAAWPTMLVESLQVLNDRMQAACDTFFQNGHVDPITGLAMPDCTSVVRRQSGVTIDPLDASRATGIWTTFSDSYGAGKARNVAAFLSISGKVTDSFELSAEARIAEEVQTRLPGVQSNIAYFVDGTENVGFSSTSAVARQSKKFTSFTPRFTAHYQVTPNHNLYAVAAKGTKPGGLNGAEAEAIGFGGYDEEKVWSFEVGSKNMFMNNQLRLNVAAFRNSFKDTQLTDSVVFEDGSPGTVTKNVGKVRIWGIEAELAYSPNAVRGLDLYANYSYTRSKILEGRDQNEGVLNDIADDGMTNCSLGYEVPPSIPGSCHTIFGNWLGVFGDISGRELPRQPRNMFNAGFTYTGHMSDSWNPIMGANLAYESKKYVQVDNLAWYGEATLVSAFIGITNGDFTLKAWGKNLTNENSAVSVSRFTDATNQSLRAFMGMPRMPRQFGVTATAKF